MNKQEATKRYKMTKYQIEKVYREKKWN